MRYSKAHKQETRRNVLDAALGSFRTAGYHGIGVDGIAKAAGVTSGAFYRHFPSKSEAFRNVISEGLSLLRNAIKDSQRTLGTKWLNSFANWYFSFPGDHAKRANHEALPMEGGCALPTLSPEIPRTDTDTRQVFEDEVLLITEVIAAGLPDSDTKQKQRLSWTLLALMVGGIVLARSVRKEKTAKQISASILASIKQLSG